MILQTDPEWATARLGHVTASRIVDVTATLKGGGYGASRTNYAAELIAERLSGQPGERYVNAAMQWGLDKEADARAAYEFRTDATCGPAAFVKHPDIEWAGASPDGFVDADGLVEFKCPNTATHLDTILERPGSVPEKYKLQMQWQMACTDRLWCDFVSYDPRLPENMRLFVRRFQRDQALIESLEVSVKVFLGEIADRMRELQKAFA